MKKEILKKRYSISPTADVFFYTSSILSVITFLYLLFVILTSLITVKTTGVIEKEIFDESNYTVPASRLNHQKNIDSKYSYFAYSYYADNKIIHSTNFSNMIINDGVKLKDHEVTVYYNNFFSNYSYITEPKLPYIFYNSIPFLIAILLLLISAFNMKKKTVFIRKKYNRKK